MKKRKRIILWVVVVVVGCIPASAAIRMFVSSTKYCRQVSAWGALDTSICVELNQYYNKHGKYPDSLEGLHLLFEDGANPNMLSQIQYQAQGTSCWYSYERHAGKWNMNVKTQVEIKFSEGHRASYMAITPGK